MPILFEVSYRCWKKADKGHLERCWQKWIIFERALWTCEKLDNNNCKLGTLKHYDKPCCRETAFRDNQKDLYRTPHGFYEVFQSPAKLLALCSVEQLSKAWKPWSYCYLTIFSFYFQTSMFAFHWSRPNLLSMMLMKRPSVAFEPAL